MKNITITEFKHYLIDINGIVYNTIQYVFGKKQIRKEPRQLKSWPNKNTGYHTVVLRNAIDKPNCVYVHRLVALAYLPNPLNLPEVNHKDFDVSNNKLENLEWVTKEQNAHHRRTQKTKSQYTPKIDAVVSNPILLKEGIELYKKHGRLDAITELWNCSTIYCSNILKMNGVKIFKKNKLSHYLKVKLLFEYQNTNMKPRHFKEYIKDKYKLDITGYLYVELRKGLPEKSYTNHA
jgi:predicted nucleic acid-binding protein